MPKQQGWWIDDPMVRESFQALTAQFDSRLTQFYAGLGAGRKGRKMAKYVGNAFSLGMIDHTYARLEIQQLDRSCARQLLNDWDAWVSCVGHQDTADLLTEMLGRPVRMHRCSVSLAIGDQLLIAQYNGPRLPEGATSLPEGARIRWFWVQVVSVG